MKRKSNIKQKEKILTFLCFLICALIASVFLLCSNYHDKKEDNITQLIIADNAITTEEIKIYSLEDNKYIEDGSIGKNVELTLENIDNKYFKIKDFNDYYIKNKDIEEISSRTTYDDRYKKYILFNYNVETTEKTTFYDEKNNMIYSFNKGYSLPLIIKEEDKYGVEFNNRLLYIKKEDSTLVEHHNTDLNNATGVGVLNYHAFYDENDPSDNCPTVICHSKSQFKEQLDFLKDNNILTLKMKELEYYIDGKINLPKSVLITIDDGYKGELAIDILSEYKMYGTIFLITSWYKKEDFKITEYIEFHSHTHNMHNVGDCPGGQGGGIKCLDKEKIQEDLKQSRELLDNSTYIAFPFYEYNDYAIQNLKEAGFTMAFIGESNYSDNLVHVGDNKYLLRRFVIVTYTTIDDLKKYFEQIK